LTETVNPTNASDKSVSWSSDNNAVATVNSSGLVTAVAAGSATITVTTTDGGFTATSSVNVSEVTCQPTSNLSLAGSAVASSIEGGSLAASNAIDGNGGSRWASTFNSDFEWIYVDLGSSHDISRVVLNWEAAFGSVYDIQVSDDASNWITIFSETSGNGGIDDINGLSGSGRYVRMNASDRGTVFGYSIYEFEIYGCPSGSSNPINVTGVTLDPSSATLEIGQSTQLTETVSPANADDKSISWSSDNTSVATVDANGLVTAVAAGSATITVTTVDGSFTATSDITVNAPAPISVTGVTLDQNSLNLSVGGSADLTETVNPSNADNKTVSWDSDNTAVATVNSSGLVTAVAAGSATITVTTADGGFTATSAVTVNSTPPTSLADTYGNGGLPGTGNAWALSGNSTVRIEAENFNQGGQGVAYDDSDAGNNGGEYRGEAVDLETTGDAGGGVNVGWTSAGEWLEYTINVPSAGTYDVRLRVARLPSGNSSVSVLFGADSDNLSNLTGSLSVQSTGGWQTWTTIEATGLSLSAGDQIMRVNMDGDSFNLNWIELEGTEALPPVLVTGVTLDPGSASLEVGQTTQLTETVNPANADDKSVSWSSDNTSVATVDANGLVTAVAAGSATITVTTTDGSFTATASISVSEITCQPTSNLALVGSAVASSVEGGSFAASNAIDGNGGSRWASAFNSDFEWIYVDLGSSHDISRVVLNWEAAFGSVYDIQVSDDASNWTTIFSETSGNGGIDDINGLSGSGQYVRMNASDRGTVFGYSIYEFEVYGCPNNSGARAESFSIQLNESIEHHIDLYPNPSSSGIISLDIENEFRGNFDVRIINTLGQKLKSIELKKDADKQAFTLDISDYNQGIYFIEIAVGNKMEIKRLIIN